MKKKMTLMRKRGLMGYVYCAPWIIGFLLFFITPVIKTAFYSFNTFDKVTLQPTFVGWANFQHAFTGDGRFPQELVNSLINMTDVPLILIFSYFAALLLRKKFKGIGIVKTIFFLTVILSSDLFLRMQDSVGAVNNAQMGASMEESQQIFSALQTIDISQYFSSLGLDPAWMNYINDAISNIFFIMIRSGVQIFIFLAALHAIPESMYEAAYMEGCTAWESFWTITFPMTGPIILVNFIYTIVDSFGSFLNPVVTYINSISFSQFEFGYSSALSWIYFICIAVIIGIVYLIFRKKIFYQT